MKKKTVLGIIIGSVVTAVAGYFLANRVISKDVTSDINLLELDDDFGKEDVVLVKEYDENCYDAEGYDEDGFNEDGFDREGYDKDGLDCYGKPGDDNEVDWNCSDEDRFEYMGTFEENHRD